VKALVILTLLALAVPLAARATLAAASSKPYYWDRPWAEYLIVKKQVAGVAPIIDAHCRGEGNPHFTPIGVREYSGFDCKVLTNVGGQYPSVAVFVIPTGPNTFKTRVS
jgi:hypothetical protein